MITGGIVFYICNRKKCTNCNEDCRHTSSIAYAVNPIFEKSRFRETEQGDWWEITNEGQGLCDNS